MSKIRVCTKCGMMGLEHHDFYIRWRSRENRYTYRHKCISCNTNRAVAYKEKYPERVKETNKVWRANNKDVKAEYNRRYNLQNQEAIKNNRYIYKYNITLEEFRCMVAQQGGRCRVCDEQEGESLHIDHNHATGEIRGLLCKSCNMALGLFNDDAKSLQGAINYINETG